MQVVIKTNEAGDFNNISSYKKQWDNIWSVNKSIALAYGLTTSDFAHILSSFPVFARKRPEFYAYLQEQVREWEKEV